jgi:hypothetical protein
MHLCKQFPFIHNKVKYRTKNVKAPEFYIIPYACNENKIRWDKCGVSLKVLPPPGNTKII